MPYPWSVLESKYLIQDKWLTVRADRCQTKEGLVIDPFYVLEVENWVNVVALNKNNQLLLIELYRHGVGENCLELPGGCIDPGEMPEVAARRELLEETGCVARELIALTPLLSNPARQNNRLYTFIGREAEIVSQQKLDALESIVVKYFEIQKVLELIDTGALSNALQVACILRAFRYLKLV